MTEAVTFSHTFVAGSTRGEILALTVELRQGDGRTWGPVTNANGQTVNGLVPLPGRLEVSICGEVYDARGRHLHGGQCVDALRRLVQEGSSPGPGLTRADLWRLLELWERWHLNGMRAACAHQRGRGETYTTHPGAACQDCGYRLGSAWLTEPLPPDVEAFVLDLRRLPGSRGAAGQAEAKASAERGTLRVLGGAPSNPAMPQASGNHWRVELRGPDRKRTMRFIFTKGVGHGGQEPTLAEVLGCLRSDAESLESTGGFEAWAREMGWDADSRQAERTYRAVVAQTAKLRACLGASYRALVEV